MIRVALQLLAIAASMAGVVVYGIIRDRQEHKPADNDHGSHAGPRQETMFFTDPQAREADVPQNRGAAMSRL